MYFSVEIRGDVVIHVGALLVTWTPRHGWIGDVKVREMLMEGVTYLLDDMCTAQDVLSEIC